MRFLARSPASVDQAGALEIQAQALSASCWRGQQNKIGVSLTLTRGLCEALGPFAVLRGRSLTLERLTSSQQVECSIPPARSNFFPTQLLQALRVSLGNCVFGGMKSHPSESQVTFPR